MTARQPPHRSRRGRCPWYRNVLSHLDQSTLVLQISADGRGGPLLAQLSPYNSFFRDPPRSIREGIDAESATLQVLPKE
jgi:hypothetical protein